MTVIGALSSFRERGEMSPHKRACVHEWASSKIVGRTGSFPERELWEPEDGFWEMTLL
jgi:hypothetical protein